MGGVPQLRPGSPPVQVHVQASNYQDTDSSTAQTVRVMSGLIARSAGDQFLCGMARGAVPKNKGRLLASANLFQLLPAASREAAAAAVCLWWATKDFIKFVEDTRLTDKLAGLENALEALTEPSVMAREMWPQGDCDCFTMFLCALMECWGLRWDIVTLMCSRRQPGVWSHVFPRVHLADNFALPMDASHGKYPGWSVPARDIQRMQVWDRDGDPVAHQAQGEVI